MQSLSRRAMPEISVDELDAILHDDGIRLVDVREDWEYRRGRVPGALSVPLGQLAQRAAVLPKDKRILLICESGSRSLVAADYLLKSGFEGAVSVRGGTDAWARTRRPPERD